MAKRSMFVGMDVHKESIDISGERHLSAEAPQPSNGNRLSTLDSAVHHSPRWPGCQWCCLATKSAVSSNA